MNQTTVLTIFMFLIFFRVYAEDYENDDKSKFPSAFLINLND